MYASIVFLTFLSFTTAVPSSKFYSFGVEHGDRELPKLQYQSSSEDLRLQVPVKFYGDSFSSLYVNTNGLVSFSVPLAQFVNIPFPLEYPVIAALYTTIDIRGTGNIYYRETSNEQLLNRATNEIRQAFPLRGSDFSASSLVIATWDHVGYYSLGTDRVNTFQVVIVTNSTESFVQFLYADDGIQWLQGQGSPNVTGLPDAKAQAGLTAYNGRIFMLPGSGTDQIRNLVRLSNTNEAGVWLFRVGDIGPDANAEEPDTRQIISQQVLINPRDSSCATRYTLCHSQAICVDSAEKFCCMCRKGFYGNGFNCLKEGTPVRANGKVTLDVNGVRLTQQDVQAYIADGRAYLAISKVPESVGKLLQVLYPVTTMLNWLFAIPTSNGLNGFQITGGVLNHSAEIIFKETNDRVSIVQKFLGLDVFDQLKLELQLTGKVPVDMWDKLSINDYQTQVNLISPGLFRSSSSSLVYKITPPTAQEEIEKQISFEQTILFNESCSLEFNTTSGNLPSDQRGLYTYYRVKTARNFISYETRENILRFAATSKVSLLTENEDPCIEGRVKCVANSSCVVEGDSFRCLCNAGFQATYASRYSEIGNNDFGCLDVNECAEGKASCHENAMCVNEIGSYQCVCKRGYSGNGFQCAEIETPCGSHSSLCNPPHSYCSIPNNYRSCSCDLGFQKRYIDDKQIAFECIDVDECETNVCGPNANCVNHEGSYSCACKTGFIGNGFQCTKTDGSCDKERNCSPNGECIYNETSQRFLCRCIKGYYGDGYQCRPYGGRRVVPTVCQGSSCICPPNFSAMNNLCVEDEIRVTIPTNDSISCNTLNNMCHPHAQCVYNLTTNQHSCVCSAGFEGNGFDCVEIELSCLKHDICDIHASCQVNNRTGKAHCVCNPHYTGYGMSCSYSGACYADTDCNQNEECYYSDEQQAYECRCIKGYIKGQGGLCVAIRTCPVCHPHASCIIDVISSNSYCKCTPGYRGDGVYSCEKIPPPCNIINNCSPHARCEYNITAAAYQCHCKRGFTGNGTYCSTTHSCSEMPELCDPNARCVSQNFGRSFHCMCNTGFTGNGSSCDEIPMHEGGFLLVNWGTATLRVPYEPSIANPGYPIQLQANQIAIGLTIDCMQSKVFWTDYSGQKIKSSSFKGRNVTTVVEGNITSPEGLTVDWLNHAIYWTDSGKKVIEAINLDGTQRRTVISKNLLNPRGIAVDPFRRKLFWSDWNRVQPKIEWSNLDGTDRSVFLVGPEVQLPNSVTTDPTTHELCWADAGTKRIMCASIENRQSRLITDNCVSPFGLTVSADKYYWTEKSLGKIGYYDKQTRKSGNLSLPAIASGTLYGIVDVPLQC